MATIYLLREGLPPQNIVKKEERPVIDIIKRFTEDPVVRFDYLLPLGSGFPVFNGAKGTADPEAPAWQVIVKVSPTDPRSEWFPYAGYYLVRKDTAQKRPDFAQ